MTSERRTTIRFRPAAPIVVQSLDTRTVLTLANLGAGGFLVQSMTGLPIGAAMRFRFSTPDGSWATLLSAQSVHSKADPDAPPNVSSFVTGFKFLNSDAPRIAASIQALIDRAMAVIPSS